jgi:hypothetical protein
MCPSTTAIKPSFQPTCGATVTQMASASELAAFTEVVGGLRRDKRRDAWRVGRGMAVGGRESSPARSGMVVTAALWRTPCRRRLCC